MPISIDEYLKDQGFWAHPFATTSAEREREFLSSFFVRSAAFEWLIGDPARPESLVLFAPVGYGKTSQRLELARELRQRRDPALVITLDSFDDLLAAPGEAVSLAAYVERIRRTTLETLADILKQIPLRKEHLERKPAIHRQFLALLHAYAPESADGLALPGATASTPLPTQSRRSAKEWFRTFAGFAHAAGFSCIYCLLDGFDELQETRNDAERLATLLRPLLDAPGLLQDCGFAFRFFLPQYVETHMRTADVGRLDRIPSRTLTWSDLELVQMLQERLRSFSRSTASSTFVRVHTFRDLVDIEYELEPFLIECAQRAPRLMLNLARIIIEEHCLRALSTTQLITQEAIDAALLRFNGNPLDPGFFDVLPLSTEARDVRQLSDNRNSVSSPLIPAPAPPNSPSVPSVDSDSSPPLLFLDSLGRIWIGDQILTLELGGTARRCLEILWDNRTRLLRYDELIEALYGADWDRRGDPRASLDKLIQRLRTMIEPGKSASQTYIKTLKGAGYVLQNYREA